MKTTIELSDALFAAAKQQAAADGTTLRALVEAGLRQVLDERSRAATYRMRDASYGEGGLAPEFANASWSDVLDAVVCGSRLVIAVDTNILVHAHRADSAQHNQAYDVVRALAEGRTAWAIPWPCVHEFLSVVTNRRLFPDPTPTAAALDQVEVWLESPSVTTLAEPVGYWSALRPLIDRGMVTGPRVHDARIAAICRMNGVTQLLTADRDFGRFPTLSTRNPLVS